MTAEQALQNLQNIGNPEMAAHSQRFFKTGPGEYGEGDIFLGIRVPVVRQQVKLFKDMPLNEIEKLLHSKYHEARLLALLIMVKQFNRKKPDLKSTIYQLYMKNTDYVNNWDLVDSSAHYIAGVWLFDKDRQVLYDLARSRNLWRRRIGMMSTFWYIKQGQFDDALAIAKILLDDKEDLIHKAVGWMLREIGNRNGQVERSFLKDRYHSMPRTMLRYAIEKFPEAERKQYLSGSI